MIRVESEGWDPSVEVVVAALEARTGTRWCANSLRARVRRLCRHHAAQELIELLYSAPGWAGMPMLVRWCETHAGPGDLAKDLTEIVDTPASPVSDESARAAVLDLSMRLSRYVGELLVEQCDTLDASDAPFARSVTLGARIEGLQEAVRFLVGSLSPTPAMA